MNAINDMPQDKLRDRLRPFVESLNEKYKDSFHLNAVGFCDISQMGPLRVKRYRGDDVLERELVNEFTNFLESLTKKYDDFSRLVLMSLIDMEEPKCFQCIHYELDRQLKRRCIMYMICFEENELIVKTSSCTMDIAQIAMIFEERGYSRDEAIRLLNRKMSSKGSGQLPWELFEKDEQQLVDVLSPLIKHINKKYEDSFHLHFLTILDAEEMQSLSLDNDTNINGMLDEQFIKEIYDSIAALREQHKQSFYLTLIAVSDREESTDNQCLEVTPMDKRRCKSAFIAVKSKEHTEL